MLRFNEIQLFKMEMRSEMWKLFCHSRFQHIFKLVIGESKALLMINRTNDENEQK